jgi:hypothetical protein
LRGATEQVEREFRERGGFLAALDDGDAAEAAGGVDGGVGIRRDGDVGGDADASFDLLREGGWGAIEGFETAHIEDDGIGRVLLNVGGEAAGAFGEQGEVAGAVEAGEESHRTAVNSAVWAR